MRLTLDHARLTEKEQRMLKWDKEKLILKIIALKSQIKNLQNKST